ncbi:MAG: tetratricopeptide repeat protein [Devosia sp.]
MSDPIPTDWQARIDALWARFDAFTPAEFLASMTALAAEGPADDPHVLFELASALDSTDHEAQAETLYRRALDHGLSGPSRRRATIQLASTLRNLSRAEEAVTLLTAERTQPSDDLDDAVAAFLGLCLADLGREREAFSLALTALAPHLPRYNRSLRNYAAALIMSQDKSDRD